MFGRKLLLEMRDTALAPCAAKTISPTADTASRDAFTPDDSTTSDLTNVSNATEKMVAPRAVPPPSAVT